ncbi:Uncharacterised protein [Edwardsiella tarda]|nr:Uncharacterised protein [Edwardsiella tarda]
MPKATSNSRVCMPRMMPNINGQEDRQPRLAPEVVSSMLLGPGVIAATQRNPTRERNRVLSMPIRLRIVGKEMF